MTTTSQTSYRVPSKYREHLGNTSEIIEEEVNEGGPKPKLRLAHGVVSVRGEGQEIYEDTRFYRGYEITVNESERGYGGHYRIGGWRNGYSSQFLADVRQEIDRRITKAP